MPVSIDLLNSDTHNLACVSVLSEMWVKVAHYEVAPIPVINKHTSNKQTN